MKNSRIRLFGLASVLLVTALVLAACASSDGAASGSPIDTVKAWNEASAQYDVAKLKDLSCAAQQAKAEQELKTAQSKGIQLQDLTRLKYEVKDANDSSASVHMSGAVWIVSATGKSRENSWYDENIPIVKEGGQWKVCRLPWLTH